MSHPESAQSRAIALFSERYGTSPDVVVRAPGRVNLIGEHTDYNDGFVMPMALPFDTVIAATAQDGGVVEVTSEGFGSLSFAIGDDPIATERWGRYVHGMANLLGADGHAVSGWRGTIATDIPAGASLSSSAALEVAAGLVTLTAGGGSLDASSVAAYGQRVENEIFGLPSGIMDQLASAASTAGCASLIDCRDLSLRAAPLPDGATVVVMDTGTRRQLVDSAYQDRQATCMAAAKALGVTALRDAGLADLERLTEPLQLRRARHVVTENQRVLDAVQAMEAGDSTAVGALMRASHRSLAEDYEVSSPALNAIVDLANDAAGCFGARMTGGGFAGCAVALVETGSLDAFTEALLAGYSAPAEQPATEPTRLYAVLPAPGASVLS